VKVEQFVCLDCRIHLPPPCILAEAAVIQSALGANSQLKSFTSSCPTAPPFTRGAACLCSLRILTGLLYAAAALSSSAIAGGRSRLNESRQSFADRSE